MPRFGATLDDIVGAFGADYVCRLVCRIHGIEDLASWCGAATNQRGCDIVIVEPGDSMSRLGRVHGVGLDALIALNGHITNPNLIYPGDELVLGCHPGAPAAINEVQRVTAAEPAGWAALRNTTEPCVIRGRTVACWTWPAIIIALHDEGLRGNDLLIAAALTVPESGRAVDAIGDSSSSFPLTSGSRYRLWLWLPSFASESDMELCGTIVCP